MCHFCVMSCHLTRLGIRPPQCVAHLAHPHPNECHPLPARHVLGDKLGQDHRGVQIHSSSDRRNLTATRSAADTFGPGWPAAVTRFGTHCCSSSPTRVMLQGEVATWLVARCVYVNRQRSRLPPTSQWRRSAGTHPLDPEIGPRCAHQPDELRGVENFRMAAELA